MKQRVLIAGCGYVGLPLGAELARQGHVVFGLRRSPDAANTLQAAGIQPLIADITRPETLPSGALPFDWVVNCTASAGGTADDYRQLYFEGTRHLLAWLSPRPPQKFVYTSSTGVYGQDDASLVKESSPAEPPTDTGRVLRETETCLLAAARDQGFPAVILRVAGIYGPERGYWFRQFLSGEAAISGDGLRHLNMIHRDDVIGCIIAALQRGKPGEIYNACDDEPVTQVHFFRWLAEELDRPMPPHVPPEAAAGQRRGATDKRISNRKLKMELGYQFKFPNFRHGYSAEIQRLGI